MLRIHSRKSRFPAPARLVLVRPSCFLTGDERLCDRTRGWPSGTRAVMFISHGPLRGWNSVWTVCSVISSSSSFSAAAAAAAGGVTSSSGWHRMIEGVEVYASSYSGECVDASWVVLDAKLLVLLR